MKNNILQRLFLTLTLCLVGIVASWANDNTYTRDGIVYTLDEANSTASVTGHKDGITIANIRSRVVGCVVTSIGQSAFFRCFSLTSVSIPSSVTSIGKSAFGACYSLTSVSIPSSVTSIGESAFDTCYSLTSVSIPFSVTSIGSNAFNGCSSLTSVSIPFSVISIGSGAFYGCSSLTSVSIPSSVTSIGTKAFFNCSSLTSVSIPSSVRKIEDYAFSECGTEDKKMKIFLESTNVLLGSHAFQDAMVLWLIPDDVSASINTIDTNKYIMGDWYYTSYNINKNVCEFGSFEYLSQNVMELIKKREDALSFISQKKNIYDVIDSNLRTSLDNLLD